MKHIFTVHSPITFFCAYEVVQHQKIKENDCIFICSNYKPPIDFGRQIKSYADTHQSVLSKLKNLNLIKSYDKYIQKIAGNNNFIAYVDLIHNYQRILITHNLCRGFHFIEEGMASYIEPNNLDISARLNGTLKFRNNTFKTYLNSILRVVRGYNLKLLTLPYFPLSYRYYNDVIFYSFSKHSFPGVLESKKIILQPTIDVFNKNYVKNKHVAFFVEESYFRNLNISQNETISVHDKTILRYKNILVNKTCYIKLGPFQNKNDSLWKTALDANDINYEFLAKDFVLDSYLALAKNCQVYGTVSSLLFYASIFGHQSFSNYSLLSQKNNVFNDLKIYWNKVNMIKDE